MNPLIFKRSKTAEDPQQLMEEVQKIMMAMGATDIEKFEMEVGRCCTILVQDVAG